MFQEYWKEYDIHSDRHGRIATHVTSLLIILRSHLTHHRFTQATHILETLAVATDRAPGVVWRAGREVLLHSGDYSHSLQLYRSFFKVLQWRIETLLETSFFIASRGNLDEAYDCLSSQLQVNPFRSHPLCHGYCAVYQYLMHKQRSTETKSEGAERVVHLNLALKHFESVEAIDAQLDGTANLDLFTKLHADLLVEQGGKDEALALLLQYKRRYPDRINPTRYVCDCLRENYVENTEVRVRYLWDSIKLDESCCEVLELVELCLRAEAPDFPHLFSTLVHFLDHPHNGKTTKAWTLFYKLQEVWPSYVECSEWKGRESWWTKLYPDVNLKQN